MSRGRRRLIFVTPWVPSERRPRSLGLLQMLTQEFDVTMIAATWGGDDVSDATNLPDDVRVVAVKQSKLTGALRAGVALASRRSLQQAFVGTRPLRKALEFELGTSEVELVYFNVLRSAHLREFVPVEIPTILDADEFRSAYFKQMAEQSTSVVLRKLSAIESRRMVSFEQQRFKCFNRVLVSSPTDLKHANTALVRSPHQMPARMEPTEAGDPIDLVFVGRMSYRANEEAILQFAQSVMPRLVIEFPDLVLHIVGDAPGPNILKLSSRNVTVHGRVPRVSDFYARAKVSVVPVNAATGVQMKLIESLTLGVPTVCTPVAAAQAGLTRDDQVLIADGTDEWVESISDLLRSSRERARLSSTGARWAAENYSWETIREYLYKELDSLL